MREASSEDIPRLLDLMEEFYRESGYPLDRVRAAEAFTALLADERLGQLWVIESGAEPVGHVVVTFCFGMEYGGTIAFIDDLFVRSPFRRRGLGAAALAEVRAFCQQRGVRAIFVETGQDNAAAKALYHRAGFTNTVRRLLALPLTART